jgi:hypothetical protein
MVKNIVKYILRLHGDKLLMNEKFMSFVERIVHENDSVPRKLYISYFLQELSNFSKFFMDVEEE